MSETNETILLLPILVSFLVTFLLLPIWMKKARAIKLVWTDMNKSNKPLVSGSGGIISLLGFVIGMFFLVAYRVFYLKTSEHLIEILALLLVVVFSSGIGFIDDLMGWRHGGLSRRSRLALLAFAAVPLMAINAGRADMNFPVLGSVNIGILYPLLFIPIGIVGATSTYNFLAGYNGLEAGQGIIILTGLGLVAFFTGNVWLTVIALCMIASLIAFIFYNYFPAEVFPGDSLTYSVGSLIAVMAILGNFEKIALFFFIPYILETLLKLRGRLVKYSFGKPDNEGNIEMPYKKIYGLEHLAIFILNKTSFKAREKRVVFLIWSFQVLLIILGFVIFREGIFK